MELNFLIEVKLVFVFDSLLRNREEGCSLFYIMPRLLGVQQIEGKTLRTLGENGRQYDANVTEFGREKPRKSRTEIKQKKYL